MKALKEKRIGFRSLLRRGLVILSLFALIFAVACGGNEGGNTDPDTGDPGTGDPGTGDPGTVTRTVKSIYVLTQPTGWSFQGLAPDLTGLTARVTWSDNNEEIMTADKFAVIPPYCDVASTKLPSGTFDAATTLATATDDTDHVIVVKDQTGAGASIIIPGVVPLKTQGASVNDIPLSLTGALTTKLYSDQVPDFTSLVVYGNYVTYDTDNIDVRKPIPVTADYPRIVGVDQYNGDTVNYLTMVVGYKGGDQNVVDSYTHQARFNIAGITKVSGITVDTASTFPKVYDDSTDLAITVPAKVGTLNNNAWITASDKIVKLLQAEGSNINLTVNYDDKTSRTLTFNDYIANLNVYNARQPGDIAADAGATPPVVEANGKKVPAVFGSDGKNGTGRTDQINWDYDDDTGNPVFNVVMNYVPAIWGQPQNHTGVDVWVDQFELTVPVLIFEQEVELRRIEGAPTNNVVTTIPSGADKIIGVDGDATGENNQGLNLLTAINTRYEAVAYYSDGTNREERVLPLTAKMFGEGRGTPAPTGTATWDDGTTDIFNLTGPNPAPTGVSLYMDWELPVSYRGVDVVDMEEGLGVLINLVPAP